MCSPSTSMFLPFAIFVFMSSIIMVISIIFCVFAFYNKVRASCWFALWVHHAHYLNQSKYGLDHTFVYIVDFNIFGLEVVDLHSVWLEIVDLFFLKLLLSLCMLLDSISKLIVCIVLMDDTNILFPHSLASIMLLTIFFWFLCYQKPL